MLPSMATSDMLRTSLVHFGDLAEGCHPFHPQPPRVGHPPDIKDRRDRVWSDGSAPRMLRETLHPSVSCAFCATTWVSRIPAPAEAPAVRSRPYSTPLHATARACDSSTSASDVYLTVAYVQRVLSMSFGKSTVTSHGLVRASGDLSRL
nr:hypothetical protein CFP56_33408 [Quercus suber]